MRDAAAMQGIQRIGDFDRVLKHLLKWERAFFQPPRERLAIEVLHDEVRTAVVFAALDHSADIRVVECRHGAGFTREAVAELRIARKFGRQEFDRDAAISACVGGLVDFARATGAQCGVDLI